MREHAPQSEHTPLAMYASSSAANAAFIEPKHSFAAAHISSSQSAQATKPAVLLGSKKRHPKFALVSTLSTDAPLHPPEALITTPYSIREQTASSHPSSGCFSRGYSASLSLICAVGCQCMQSRQKPNSSFLSVFTFFLSSERLFGIGPKVGWEPT